MVNPLVVVVFISFLLLFVGVGIAASWRSKDDSKDYFLAGRGVPPWLVALSAASTSNSGFMFIGMIGFTYTSGISSAWYLIGYIIGDFLMSLRVYPAVRESSERTGAISYAGMIARWGGEEQKPVRLAIAVLSLIFLSIYAAAQFRAGGKALVVLFEWPEMSGVMLGAAIVFAYCIFGGIRASIWTDAVQAIVMVMAMGLVVMTGIVALGGFSGMAAALPESHFYLFPQDMAFGWFFGPLLLVLGWFVGGISYVGQPHIMVRYMTMRSVEDMYKVRVHYYSWSAIFYVLAILCGLSARALLPDVDVFDPELAMPMMAMDLLPALLVGFVLSGIFAATVSTADSQIISCSTVLAHDLLPENQRNSIIYARAGTCIITLVAFFTAIYGSGSVFDIVLLAWAGMGCAFGPVLLVWVFGGKPSTQTVLSMMAAGLAAVVVWRYLGLQGDVYEILPGMAAGFAVYFGWHFFQGQDAGVETKSSLATRS